MQDITYKEYSKEESRIYESAVEQLSKSMAQGLTLDDAASRLNVADEELKRLIIEDFLKIYIVQLHYEKGLSLKDVASAMGIPYERIVEAHKAMLQDVRMTAVTEYHKSLSKGQA